MKFLVLLFYYNRPTMVQQALKSVRESTHEDWEIAFLDDGSQEPFRFINSTNMPIKYYRNNQTPEDKLKRGSNIGRFINKAIKKSNADIAFMLCDDDAVLPDYMENLNQWFKDNPDEVYCWSKIYQWFRTQQHDYRKADDDSYCTNFAGDFYADRRIIPHFRVDVSQVAWRREKSAPFYRTLNERDANFFRQMFLDNGHCPYTGFFSQYKGVHSKQIIRVPENRYDGDRE